MITYLVFTHFKLEIIFLCLREMRTEKYIVTRNMNLPITDEQNCANTREHLHTLKELFSV